MEPVEKMNVMFNVYIAPAVTFRTDADPVAVWPTDRAFAALTMTVL